jgi:hypothetical protein
VFHELPYLTRIMSEFKQKRQAMLLLGADKNGLNDKKSYATYTPQAETLWEEYLQEIK